MEYLDGKTSLNGKNLPCGWLILEDLIATRSRRVMCQGLMITILLRKLINVWLGVRMVYFWLTGIWRDKVEDGSILFPRNTDFCWAKISS